MLAVKAFGDIGQTARLRLIRDRFIAGQSNCDLRRHLDSAPPETPIRDVVDRCRVWESHADPAVCRTSKPTPDPMYLTHTVGETDSDNEITMDIGGCGHRTEIRPCCYSNTRSPMEGSSGLKPVEQSIPRSPQIMRPCDGSDLVEKISDEEPTVCQVPGSALDSQLMEEITQPELLALGPPRTVDL